MAGPSSRGFGVTNPDLQTDADIDSLPTYNRGTYQPHPSLPGKLQSEAQWLSSDSQSVSDTTESWGDALARPQAAVRAQRIARPHVPPALSLPLQTSAISADTRIGSAPSLAPQLFPTTPRSPTRSPRPSLTVEIPTSPTVPGVYAMQEHPAHGYIDATAYGRQQPMHAVQPPHLGVGKDPATFICPYCGMIQQTNTRVVSGDYTMMMSIMCGFLACMWCVPYMMDGFKDVEHACGNCSRSLSVWQRNGGKVVPSTGQVLAVESDIARPMKAERIQRMTNA